MDDRRFETSEGPRRRRRGPTRALRRVLGLADEETENLDLVWELHRWILGLPFVEELDPVQSAPRIRRFGVNCPPLGLGAVVLLTGSFAADDDDPETVMVVLPRPVARMMAAGRSPGPDVDGGRTLVCIGLPADPDELVDLEDVVSTAYLSMFPPA